MAKKAAKVAAQSVDTPALVDTLPDISNLSESALSELIAAAQNRKYDLQDANAAEREAAWKETLKSDDVKAIRAELKELEKEYAALLKNGHTVTYNIPLTLTVEIGSYNDGYYGDDLSSILSSHGFSDVGWEELFGVQVDGSIGKSDLPKDVREVMNENLSSVLADACSQVARLTPDLVKQFEAFCKKVNKFTSKADKVNSKVDPDSQYSMEDVLGV